MPDVDSMSTSPVAAASISQRASQSSQPQNGGDSQTATPPASASATAAAPASASPSMILPSNQQALQQASAGSLPSPSLPASAMHPPPAPGQDSGPGPLRHPRPLTAAELHQQVEQEQELLVNRLTRDLSMLRAAQNSSVVSNTSSASASTSADQAHPSSFTDTHLLSGPGFPIPTTSADRRHHRTSSSTSTRSFSNAASQGSTPAPINIPHSGNAASILEAARNPRGPSSMSRQNSSASRRSQSRNHSPPPYYGALGSSSYTQSHGFPHEHVTGYFPRGHTSSNPSIAATPGSELSPGLMPATLRYEETAHFRHELDAAKRENDMLKRRIKELERTLRDRRESDASRGGGRDRSGSTSTTTSISVSGGALVGGSGASIAGGRRDERRGVERAVSSLSISGSVGVGVPEDEIKFGESAAGATATPQQTPHQEMK
ncbi:hypothetical protein F4780DRAFT_170900 [Xylariomycetidae sp. FL0641]|nr:hypothetical protein F4780DRAFT_170900 [Xylariomycetidae sp. FL0641]